MLNRIGFIIGGIGKVSIRPGGDCFQPILGYGLPPCQPLRADGHVRLCKKVDSYGKKGSEDVVRQFVEIILFLHEEMAGEAGADNTASVDGPVANGIVFLYLSVAGEQIQTSYFLYEDIPIPVFGKVADIAFQMDLLQCRIVLLVIDLSFVIITDGSAEGSHPYSSLRVPEYL